MRRCERYTYIDDDANRVLSVDLSDQSFWELGGWSDSQAKLKKEESKKEMPKKEMPEVSAKYKHSKHARSDMGSIDNP